MKRDELTQPEWGHAPNYLRERDKRYRTTGLKDSAVVDPQSDEVVASPAPTTFVELMECVDIVPRQSQMLQLTSPQGSLHLRLGSGRPHTNKHMLSHSRVTKLNSSPIA